MYTEQDLIVARGQRNKRLLLSALILVLMIAIMVWGLIVRNKLLASVGPMALACVFYFVLDMKAMPYVRYARYLYELETGRRREHEAVFASMPEGTRFVDGVEVYDLMACTDDAPEVESLFYFDADKPRPELLPGQKVRITCYDKFVTGIEPLV